VKRGTAGNEIKLQEYLYTARTVRGTTRWVLKKRVCYPSEQDQLFQIDCTAYTYHWYEGSFRIQERTTHWPMIPADENGSGIATQRIERFDEFGNRIWVKDQRGFLTRMKYDLASGAIIQRIVDADTSRITDEPSVPPGWATPEGGGLHLVTDFTVDPLGRVTLALGPPHEIDIDGVSTPIRRAGWTVYKDAEHETRQASGYAIWHPESGIRSWRLLEPIGVVKRDLSGRVIDTIQTRRAPGVTGPLTADEDLSDQSRWVRWRKNIFCNNRETQPNAERVYFAIPPIGEGDALNNYMERSLTRDKRRQLVREHSPGGTITRNVYHPKGWLLEKWVGTNDIGATNADPSGGGAPGNNMKRVWSYEYDDGKPAEDGSLTSETAHVNDDESRKTHYEYDFRKRRTRKLGELGLREDYTYDNLRRLIQTDSIDATTGTLIGRNETKYDRMGRIFRTIKYGVNPKTGAVGKALTDDIWYDPSGNVMKQAQAGSRTLQKASYDGAGRAVRRYVTYNLTDTTCETAGSVATDTVMQQEEIRFDAASNVIQQTTRQRFHDATGVGPLTSPKGPQPKARVNFAASWPDTLGRQQAQANYGTNGGAELTRPPTIPVRSDTVLVTSTAYNAAGQASQVRDPAGQAVASAFDNAGRQTSKIEDYGSGAHLNRTTLFSYTLDGKLQYLTAKNAVTGDQTTKFVYGTTLADSGVARSDLLRGKIYPDSSDSDKPLTGTDHVEYKYDRLGELKEVKDQLGTVRTLDYDKLGRLIHDRMTTLASNVDGTVRRISRSYETRGLLEKITSHDDATIGSGNVVNEVQYEYDDFSQPVCEYQSHDGPVDTAQTPKVEHGYADGSENNVRPTSLKYPDGRVTEYDYGGKDGTDDLLSRTKALKQGTTTLVDYAYLGLKGFVRVDYRDQPGVELTYIKQSGEPDGDAGDPYTGLDRFGRVVDQRWIKTSDRTARERLKYGYDRASNHRWRKNIVAGGTQDEFYTYDTVYQLKVLKRGTLNESKTAIEATPNWEEGFSFDPTGNWNGTVSAYKTLVNGITTLDQNRAHNAANEATKVTTQKGPLWFVPLHNSTGNMIQMPQPLKLGESFDVKYDAWNRLVELKSDGNLVARYAYDGLTRRVSQVIGGNTRHFYYSHDWQILEERLNQNAAAERQFVWGQRNRDDLVLRDKASERLYVLQDHFQPTAIISPNGAVQERYGYEAFGMPRYLDANFVIKVSGDYEWETLFAGYRYDHESGLYQVRYRYLHPRLGRWLSRDPLAYVDGLNLYAYVNNRPIFLVDPTGEAGWLVVIGLLVGIYFAVSGVCNFFKCKDAAEEIEDAIVSCHDSYNEAHAAGLPELAEWISNWGGTGDQGAIANCIGTLGGQAANDALIACPGIITKLAKRIYIKANG